MYSVLIVDDELAIREGLTALLDWESSGFQIIDTAANAIEAKYKYELYSPDLMIVDIRMPGRDGLELIKELRENDPEMHIIILSGYADFDYAKRALAFGIDNYLLKPQMNWNCSYIWQNCPLSWMRGAPIARIMLPSRYGAVKCWFNPC